jgi:hypothetical protein
MAVTVKIWTTADKPYIYQQATEGVMPLGKEL